MDGLYSLSLICLQTSEDIKNKILSCTAEIIDHHLAVSPRLLVAAIRLAVTVAAEAIVRSQHDLPISHIRSYETTRLIAAFV